MGPTAPPMVGDEDDDTAEKKNDFRSGLDSEMGWDWLRWFVNSRIKVELFIIFCVEIWESCNNEMRWVLNANKAKMKAANIWTWIREQIIQPSVATLRSKYWFWYRIGYQN